MVALTGYGSRRDRERSHRAGFDDHRVKPLSDADLRSVLLAAQSAQVPGVWTHGGPGSRS
jgi:CheY-like chemotaxis protein